MALTTPTTLAAAITSVDQLQIQVASATGIVAGMIGLIDGEFVRVAPTYTGGVTIQLNGRGLQGGSLSALHNASTSVVFGLPSDFAAPAQGGPQVTYQTQRATDPKTSISTTAQAIPLPAGGRNGFVVLNGTGVLASTLAAPTADMEGCRLVIVGNGKAAHTVTVSGGLGNNTTNSDVITFNASQQQAVELIAVGGATPCWLQLSGLAAGAATVAAPGLA